MVVDQIDIHRFAVFEAEHDSPVAAHPDAPLFCTITLECMEPITWEVHITRCNPDVEISQDSANARNKVLWQCTRAFPFMEVP